MQPHLARDEYPEWVCHAFLNFTQGNRKALYDLILCQIYCCPRESKGDLHLPLSGHELVLNCTEMMARVGL